MAIHGAPLRWGGFGRTFMDIPNRINHVYIYIYICISRLYPIWNSGCLVMPMPMPGYSARTPQCCGAGENVIVAEWDPMGSCSLVIAGCDGERCSKLFQTMNHTEDQENRIHSNIFEPTICHIRTQSHCMSLHPGLCPGPHPVGRPEISASGPSIRTRPGQAHWLLRLAICNLLGDVKKKWNMGDAMWCMDMCIDFNGQVWFQKAATVASSWLYILPYYRQIQGWETASPTSASASFVAWHHKPGDQLA